MYGRCCGRNGRPYVPTGVKWVAWGAASGWSSWWAAGSGPMKPSSVSRVYGPSSHQSRICLRGSDHRRPCTDPLGEGLKAMEASRPSLPRLGGARWQWRQSGDGQRRVAQSRCTRRTQRSAQSAWSRGERERTHRPIAPPKHDACPGRATRRTAPMVGACAREGRERLTASVLSRCRVLQETL